MLGICVHDWLARNFPVWKHSKFLEKFHLWAKGIPVALWRRNLPRPLALEVALFEGSVDDRVLVQRVFMLGTYNLSPVYYTLLEYPCAGRDLVWPLRLSAGCLAHVKSKRSVDHALATEHGRLRWVRFQDLATDLLCDTAVPISADGSKWNVTRLQYSFAALVDDNAPLGDIIISGKFPQSAWLDGPKPRAKAKAGPKPRPKPKASGAPKAKPAPKRTPKASPAPTPLPGATPMALPAAVGISPAPPPTPTECVVAEFGDEEISDDEMFRLCNGPGLPTLPVGEHQPEEPLASAVAALSVTAASLSNCELGDVEMSDDEMFRFCGGAPTLRLPMGASAPPGPTQLAAPQPTDVAPECFDAPEESMVDGEVPDPSVEPALSYEEGEVEEHAEFANFGAPMGAVDDSLAMEFEALSQDIQAELALGLSIEDAAKEVTVPVVAEERATSAMDGPEVTLYLLDHRGASQAVLDIAKDPVTHTHTYTYIYIYIWMCCKWINV